MTGPSNISRSARHDHAFPRTPPRIGAAMIPGSIGDAAGLFFFLAAFSCAAIGIKFALRGVAEIIVSARTRTPIATDSGTVAVLFAGAFVLVMLGKVAVA